MRATDAEHTQIRYADIAARSRPYPFSSPLKFCHLFFTHATKLLFDVKQPNRLSLRPLSISSPLLLISLSLSPPFLPLSLFSLSHTIIAFVPLWSLVVLNLHVCRGQKGGKRRRNTYLSIPRHVSNAVSLLVQKRPSQKKGPRARVSFGAQLIEVHLCARPAMRRSGISVVAGYPRCALPSLSFRELLASTNLGWRGRETTGWAGRSGEQTLIKPS